MLKNTGSKIAWFVTIMFACIYIFSSLGDILTNLMENTVAYVIISIVFVSSAAGVFMDILARLDDYHSNKKVEDR